MPQKDVEAGDLGKVMRTFTAKIGPNVEKLLSLVKRTFGISGVLAFTYGLALLKIAAEASQDGCRLVVARGDQIEKEIVLPLTHDGPL